MPKFEIVPLKDAQMALALTGARGKQLRQYVEFLQLLQPGEAGKVTAGSGDTTAAIRRRLTAAADLLSREIELNRQDNIVYVLDKSDAPTPRRRRRRAANAEE